MPRYNLVFVLSHPALSCASVLASLLIQCLYVYPISHTMQPPELMPRHTKALTRTKISYLPNDTLLILPLRPYHITHS